MTISREQLRELAEFQDVKSCAVSFYFQPSTPRNKAHKEDMILIKDLAREALRSLESKSSTGKEAGKEKEGMAREKDKGKIGRVCSRRLGPHCEALGRTAQQRNPRQGRVRLRR